MSISSVSSITSAPSAAASQDASKTGMNYNNFLQLLVTELKHQDPMKPLDPTQTVTQLATFSSVEQAVKTNALLSSLAPASRSTPSDVADMTRRITEAVNKRLGKVMVKEALVTNFGFIPRDELQQ